jgi:hypothetical protein
MSGFSLDWLRLRAPFDRAARDPGLSRRFAAALRRPSDRPLRLVDLGTGTGANARSLAPVIGGDQDWLLVDNDAALLGFCAAEHIAWATREGYGVDKEAGAVVIRAGDARWRLAARRLDLATDLAAALADPYDGLALSGLADLASPAWIDALAVQIERRRVPLLSTLMVDGRRQWHPPGDADALVREAFAAHQRRDEGLGPALAGAAPVYLGARMAAAGCAVATATSDWQVGPEQRAMLATVLEAERRAALRAHPEAEAAIARWAEERRAQLAAGRLSLTIGHRDLLALPREM